MTKHVNSTGLVPFTHSGTTERGSASTVSLIVYGQLWSMKNGKIPRRNAPGMMKHPKARQFEKDFIAQVPRSAMKALGSLRKPLRANVTVYYPSWRQDLDAELVFDLLQKAGVVRNDRYIREKHLYGAQIDPKNPRVEITIEEL